MLAIQDQIINMRNYRKHVLKNKQNQKDAEDVHSMQKVSRMGVLDCYVEVASFKKMCKS
jgi:hypothetical protein